MRRKITAQKVIWSFIGMLITMYVLTLFFKYLLIAINILEPTASLVGILIGMAVPGVVEFVNIILPYIKQQD